MVVAASTCAAAAVVVGGVGGTKVAHHLTEVSCFVCCVCLFGFVRVSGTLSLCRPNSVDLGNLEEG
jgi:hypothetical protein